MYKMNPVQKTYQNCSQKLKKDITYFFYFSLTFFYYFYNFFIHNEIKGKTKILLYNLNYFKEK